MAYDTKNQIEITGVDLKKFIKEVYALSNPQGAGYIHYVAGDLPDEDAEAIIARETPNHWIAADMDYVRGRACKMSVWRDTETGKLYISCDWFDHSPDQLRELLRRVGLNVKIDQVRERA